MELTLTEVQTHPSSVYDGREEVLVLLTGDWQLDPVLRGKPRVADTDRIRRIIEWGQRHDAYFMGFGDYADALSPSNREAWDSARLYDSARDAMEQAAERTQDELEELTRGTEGRWLGLLEGHHYFVYDDRSTTDTRLAAFLRAPFLGDEALVHLLLPAAGAGNKKRPMARIWGAHGQGSGQPGSALAKVEKTGMRIVDNADIYAMGHQHKVEQTRVQRISSFGGERGGKPMMNARDIVLACTGSGMRGHIESSRRGGRAQGSYVEKALMSPSSLGAVWVSIKPAVSSRGYAHLDLDSGTI